MAKTVSIGKDSIYCGSNNYWSSHLYVDSGNSRYIEKLDENHYISVYLDYEYTTEDFF